MTDKEKILRHDTLITLRTRIKGCFGSEDGIFAGHTMDSGRAKELRKLALQDQITLTEISELALAYLFDNASDITHITQQLEKVKHFFGEKIQ